MYERASFARLVPHFDHDSIASLLAIALSTAMLSSCARETWPPPPADSYSAQRFTVVFDENEPSIVDGAAVSDEFFRVTQVRPLLGRLLIGDEFRRPSTRVAVLSYRCWQSRFRSSAEIIGRTIRIDDHQTVVVGVLPKSFDVPANTCLWLPRN